MVPFESIWSQVAPLVAKAERPSRYINHEWGSVYKPEAGFRFCMVYPDTYELGQANQALRILVNAVNARDGMVAERGFLPAPDMCDALRREGLPLFSIESCAPLGAFDVIGITLPHELAATNVLEALDLAGLPLHAVDRAEDDPLVVAGGPCALNPEPYAPFFAAINIGEGEESLPEGLEVIRTQRARGASRREIWRALAALDGWYVPSLYRWREADEAQEAGSWIEPLEEGLPTFIEKQVFRGFAESPAWEPCIVPFTEAVHDRLNVEILRGCARGCRFCQAGMMYRPVRERTADNIVASVLEGLAETGYDEVSLTSLSSTDHSQISEILTRLNRECAGKGVRISILCGERALEAENAMFAEQARIRHLLSAKDGTLAEQKVMDSVNACTEALGDSGRVLLRKSGTEPVLRVMSEATSQEECEKYVDYIINAMKESGHLIEVKK